MFAVALLLSSEAQGADAKCRILCKLFGSWSDYSFLFSKHFPLQISSRVILVNFSAMTT